VIDKFKKSKQYLKLLNAINVDKGEDIDNLINDFLIEISHPKIEDIWLDEDVAISYWIFISNNIFSNKEAEFAKQLLFWREVYGKSNAKVKCLLSSENKYYNLLIKELKIKTTPTLIISNTPDFESTIILSSKQISKINHGNLISFFNSFHSQILAGEDFQNLGNNIQEISSLDDISIVNIKKLISQNRIDLALNKVNNILTSESEDYNDFILVKSQIKQIESNKLQGFISEQDYLQSRSKLINSLINFIDVWCREK